MTQVQGKVFRISVAGSRWLLRNIRDLASWAHPCALKSGSQREIEAGDRWFPGPYSWCLWSGVKRKLWSHAETPRTKLVAEAELCWSNEMRCPLLRPRKTSLSHRHRKAPWGSEIAPLQNKCGRAPTDFYGGTHHSKKTHTRVGESTTTRQVWKKKQDNWPKVNEHLEGLSYMRDLNHLFTSFLLIREAAHTLSFWVCISACFCLK